MLTRCTSTPSRTYVVTWTSASAAERTENNPQITARAGVTRTWRSCIVAGVGGLLSSSADLGGGAVAWSPMSSAHLAVLFLLAAGTATAVASEERTAGLTINVDISSKRMRVSVDRKEKYIWSVATGPGRMTRPGRFGIQALDADHYSSIYGNEPMPHSIFYDGNRAVHGTSKKLAGHRTHGCIALSRSNAKTLFQLVRENGSRATIIVER